MKHETFTNITRMVAFWEKQEREEATPVIEKVVIKRRRSKKLEGIVKNMGLEALVVEHKPTFSDGGEASKEAMKTTSILSYNIITKPQTLIYLGSGEIRAGKRERESVGDYEENKKRRVGA